MATLAGYAYFSRAEEYYIPGGSPDTWAAAVRVYSIDTDGVATFLGSGTYTAAQIDAMGMRFGYTPKNESQAANPALDPYYAITPGDLVFVDPFPLTERAYWVKKEAGDTLLDPAYYDVSEVSPSAIESGKNYLAVAYWEDLGGDVYPLTVFTVIEITADFWSGISTTDDSHRVSYAISAFGGDLPDNPEFWTSIVGAKERP